MYLTLDGQEVELSVKRAGSLLRGTWEVGGAGTEEMRSVSRRTNGSEKVCKPGEAVKSVV